MSRQQKRANERKLHKTAFQKISLAAGEGVGRAVAFSFALASNAFAAEPKKEEPITLPPVVVQDQNSPYVVPRILSVEISRAAHKTRRNRSRSCRRNSSKSRAAPPCAMRCATCLASPPQPAKAAAHRVTFSRCAGSTRATTCSSMACVIPAPIFAIRSISSPSKY